MDTSSLNELISRSSMLAYKSGQDQERMRVIRILKSLPKEFSNNDYVLRAVAKAVVLIRDTEKSENQIS